MEETQATLTLDEKLETTSLKLKSVYKTEAGRLLHLLKQWSSEWEGLERSWNFHSSDCTYTTQRQNGLVIGKKVLEVT